MKALPRLLPLGAALLLTATGAVWAAPPRLRIMPPNNNGFLVDQRFDIRGEATLDAGRTLTSISLTVDGVNLTPFAAIDGAPQNSITFRKFSTTTPGLHTISVSARDSGGETATLTQSFSIVNPSGSRRRTRNIIILLGDGMGAAHRTAARLTKYPLVDGRTTGILAMDTMPGTASVLTHSLNSMITDSAPGMASYVTGSKSFNGQEGVYPDNTGNGFYSSADNTGAFDNPRVEYLSEYMHRNYNKVLGIVSTADVEDATPASMAIHTQNRGAGTGVCDQYFDERDFTGLRVLMGGGRRWFIPNPTTTPGTGTINLSSRSIATDYQLPPAVAAALGVPTGALDPGRDLIGDFKNAGFTYAATRTDLLNPAITNTDRLLGLFAYGNMNVAMDKIYKRRNQLQPGRSTHVVDDYFQPDQPMLDEMTDVALNVLNRNRDGFVLMVEGAHIDKQSHLMDADRAIWETIEFDNAVKKCLDFANRVGDTLVIVTADHECSGFSIIGSSTKTKAQLKADIGTRGAADRTSPAAPYLTQQNTVGTYDAAAFPQYTMLPDGYPADPDSDKKILIGFGANGDRFEDWLSKPLPVIDSLLTTGLQTDLGTKGYVLTPLVRPLQTDGNGGRLGGFFLRGHVSGDQAVHTASEILLSAYSSAAPGTTSNAWQQFRGLIDNTDVFFFAARALLGGY